MARIKFVDLPANVRRARPGRPMTPQKAAVIAACKDEPGRWTIWPTTAIDISNVVWNINAGRVAGLAGFEAVRFTDETGTVRCYIRYVGGEAA